MGAGARFIVALPVPGVSVKRGDHPIAHEERKRMENAVKSRLQSVQFGAVQTYKSIAIVPLIAPTDGMFQYRTLTLIHKDGEPPPSPDCWQCGSYFAL